MLYKIHKTFICAATATFINFTPPQAFASDSKDFESRLQELENIVKQNSQTNLNNSILKSFQKAKIIGRLHVDTRFYDEDDNLGDSEQDGIDIKRARLGIKGKLSDNFSYKFENDFAKNASTIQDAYIAYDGIKNAQFKLGQFRQAFSLNELTSSNNITFLDRSIAISSAPGRTVGFQGTAYGNNWQLSTGVFGESTGNESRTDDSKYSGSIRASYAPISHDGKLIHLGIASNITSQDRDTSTTGANTSANVLDRQTLYGAELALGLHSFLLQGEYIKNKSDYDKDATGTNLVSTTNQKDDYNSYYVQASYFITGENRIYKVKEGLFKGVKVKNSFDKGGVGAWQLAARFAKHEENDSSSTTNIINKRTSRTTFGVNWYLNNNVRLMANYIKSDTEKKSGANEKYDAFLMRAQLSF